MNKDIDRIFFTEEQIKEKVKELGAQLTRDYEGKNPLVIGVLKGAFVAMADIVRSIDTECEVEFMAVSTYGLGTTSSGQINITRDLGVSIENRHVIIIEDVLDSGVTLSYLKSYLLNRKPASLAICAFIDKPARRKSDIQPDYVGFADCPDEFIVGYGLDYAEKYRNLPYIGVLKPELYE